MPVSLDPPDRFALRHIGPDPAETEAMLVAVGAKSLDDLIDQTIPASIRLRRPLSLPAARSEHDLLVLAVHALPGGGLAGTPRGAPQLPDRGQRPHRAAGRQRLAARRSHRRGR